MNDGVDATSYRLAWAGVKKINIRRRDFLGLDRDEPLTLQLNPSGRTKIQGVGVYGSIARV